VACGRRGLQSPSCRRPNGGIRLGLDDFLQGLETLSGTNATEGRDKLCAVWHLGVHEGGSEDQALGRAFIARAAEALRPGGALWLVANAHLPYEASLREAFRHVAVAVQANGYRVYEARR